MDPYIREYKNEPIIAKIIPDIDHFLPPIQTPLNILHLNIRSAMKNMDEFVLFLNKLALDIQIIVLTETYFVYDLNLLQIEGYTILYNEGSLNKNDGVLVYIRNEISFSHEIKKLGNINILEVSTQFGSKKAILTAVYRPPSTCPKKFNIDLQQYIQTVERSDMHVITGDINIDLMSNSDFSEEYKNILNTYGYESHINDYTRPESKTCIDHFYVKENVSIPIQSYVFQHIITDHYPIALTVDLDATSTRQPNSDSRNKKYIDYAALKTNLREERWEKFYSVHNIDEMADEFVDRISAYIEKTTKNIRLKKQKNIKKKWITSALLTSINRKQHLYKNLQKDPNNSLLKTEYHVYKGKLAKLIKVAKKNYARKLIKDNVNQSKALWDSVNNICNRSKPETRIEKIVSADGTMVESGKRICDSFNAYYSNLGQTYAEKISVPENYREHEKTVRSSLFLTPANIEEVHETIVKLRQGTAPGYDGIRAETLKNISDEIKAPLTHLINCCFDEGYFPKSLKTGIIKPLFKKGSRLEMKNYRPISLISNIAKVMEKILKKRIIKFCTKHKIISQFQYGFVEEKSTEDAIRHLTSCIYNSLDKKKQSLCIFIDLSKAFDTVSHEKLLNKLEKYGFRGKIYNMMRSYLMDREQKVSVNGELSEAMYVNYGVPQGTVLGPLLFTLYINSLLSVRVRGRVLCFADDVALFCESDSWNTLKAEAEKDFSNLDMWFRYNKLTINLEKTRYLPFASYSSGLPHIGPLMVTPNLHIPEADSIKYLGITIDRHLKWDMHIKSIVNKLRGILYKIKYLKDYLDLKHLKLLYFALVQPQLSYGIIGWGGVNDNHLENLNVMQRWILRIIYGKPLMFSNDSLYRESGMLDIRQLFCLSMLINMKKSKITSDPVDHCYNTRNRSSSLNIPRCEKNIGQRCCNYLAPKVFNQLPSYIKKLNSLSLFRKMSRKWIVSIGRSGLIALISQRLF